MLRDQHAMMQVALWQVGRLSGSSECLPRHWNVTGPEIPNHIHLITIHWVLATFHCTLTGHVLILQLNSLELIGCKSTDYPGEVAIPHQQG